MAYSMLLVIVKPTIRTYKKILMKRHEHLEARIGNSIKN